MKRTKRIRFNKKPLLTSLAVLSIAATGLPLLQATNVQAADYTAEEIQEMTSEEQGGYWYEHDFDNTHPWDGTELSPEEVQYSIEHPGNISPEYMHNGSFHLPESEKKKYEKTILMQGIVTVSNKNSSYCKLFSFSEDGSSKVITNRALANSTKWITDRYRIHNGHYYYRVATNEWVQDTVVINIGPR